MDMHYTNYFRRMKDREIPQTSFTKSKKNLYFLLSSWGIRRESNARRESDKTWQTWSVRGISLYLIIRYWMVTGMATETFGMPHCAHAI